MKPAVWPRDRAEDERLLFVDPRGGALSDGRVGDLPAHLRAGDLVIVNDAATMPASLHGKSAAGEAVEVRLVDLAGARDGRFRALLFGAGDFRTRTEDRPAPPRLGEGDVIVFGEDLSAVIERVPADAPRLVEIAFRERGAALWAAIYRHGRPVQYAYVRAPLELWHTQTRYASRPWAAEMPSAGRPLTWGMIFALLRRGVRVASLTHAAGLSSTGDAALDARLPLPERFEIPAETVEAIRATKAEGGRVIAVGTTVVRALEGCAALHGGEVVAGAGTTDLVIGAEFRPRVVDGLLTGMHEPEASHYRLLEAFAPLAVLNRAHAHAVELGYLAHEFGDSSLILAAGSRSAPRRGGDSWSGR